MEPRAEEIPSSFKNYIGIPGFERLLPGTEDELRKMLRGTTFLVEGPPGAGKSIFSMQCLCFGVKLYNEPSIYLSFEENLDNLLERDFNFDLWDIKAHVMRWEDTGLDKVQKREVPERLKELKDKLSREAKIIIITGRDLEGPFFKGRPIAEGLGELIKDLGIQRIVIDPITVYLLHERERLVDLKKARSRDEATRIAMVELKHLEEASTKPFIVLPCEAVEEGRPLLGYEEFVSRGVIYLGFREVGGKRKRYARLLKMRGSRHSTKRYAVFISKQEGLRIGYELLE